MLQGHSRLVLANTPIFQCDEQWPRCNNCETRNIRCERPVQGPKWLSAAEVEAAPKLRIYDLELLYHFTSSTYATLTDDPRVRELWRTQIVTLALSCEYLMLALLSVAALHLQHLDPSRGEELSFRAMTYHEKASRLAVGIMSGVQNDQAANCFAFSVLTIYYGLLIPESWTTPTAIC